MVFSLAEWKRHWERTRLGLRWSTSRMDGTDDDVLLRMRENAGSFEAQSDRRDERVNDGNNYKGMMRAEDYKKRREEVLGGKELAEQKKSEAIANAVKADRAAAVEDARSREERERARKEKLQRELQQQPTDEQADDDNDGTSAAKKKKKRKRPNESAGLSFDVEDDS